MILYPAAFLFSFVTVTLKGFQYKSVSAGHTKSSVALAFVLTCLDVTNIRIVATSGWPIALAAGSGAALGMLAAIRLHDYVFRKAS